MAAMLDSAAQQHWDIPGTLAHITSRGYQRIALQFPDDLLHDSPLVAQTLQSLLAAGGSAAKVAVLADTSYNPLSVDEVAAAHMDADCVVHYGYASLNPVSRIPALCVLPRLELDVQQAAGWVAQQLAELAAAANEGDCQPAEPSSSSSSHPVAVLCCDQGFMHAWPQLQQALLAAYQGAHQLVFAESAPLELLPRGSLATAGHSRGGSAAGQQLQQQQGCSNCSCTAQPNLQQPADLPAEAAAAAAAATAPLGDDLLAPVGGLTWQLPRSSTGSSSTCGTGQQEPKEQQQEQQQQPTMVWLGPAASPALTHLQLTYSRHSWLLLDPCSRGVQRGLSDGLERLLRRRAYLVERARAASLVGLLVGTLGAAGYLTALQQLRSLAAQAGKKTYTLLMGKPNPAKLANFPELEVFVMLADPQGLVLDCKEYLAPLVTPHEAWLAFTGRALDPARYRLDFGDLLALEQQQQQQQGEEEGAAAGLGPVAVDEEGDGGASALVVAGSGLAGGALRAGSRTGQQVQARTAAQYLTQHRSYKGLETPATGAEIKAAVLAVEGRSGRAAAYEDEPSRG